MAAETLTLGCRLFGCGGPRSGVCINNLSFDECPDVIELDEKVEDTEEAAETSTRTVLLPGGRSLNAEACDALLRQRSGIVVGLVAGPDVGKTTLIATMYELLHRRRIAASSFAGSETLRGYEERSYLARASSNAAVPNTHRTPTSAQLNFTHLRVVSGGELSNVFFSDRSGEHFESVLNRPGDIDNFPELHRANAILMLVDLVRLVNDTHVTVSAVRRLLMAMVQNELLAGKKTILVGTKADIAIPTPTSRKAERELRILTDELNNRTGGQGIVGRQVIACRARRGTTVIGEGIESLLQKLLVSRPPRQQQPDDSWPNERSDLDQLMRQYRSRQ